MNKINKIGIFVNFVLLITTILNKPEKNEIFNPSLVFFFSIISLFAVLYFFKLMRKVYNTWVRYDVFFLISFLIVHFQIVFFESIGIEPLDPNKIWINKNVVNYATWLSTICILAWLIGFLFFISSKRAYSLNTHNVLSLFKIKTGIIDLILLILFLLFLLLVGTSFLTGAYDGVRNWGEGATYVFLILKITIYLRIIYLFINYGKYIQSKYYLLVIRKNKMFLTILFLLSLIFILSSDRGMIMYFGLISFGSFSLFVKEVPLKNFLVLFTVGLVFFSFIRMGRTGNVSITSQENIFERSVNNLAEQESFNPSYELASSCRILYRAVDMVPDQHPYLYGFTNLSNIVSVIPFTGSFFSEATNTPSYYNSSTTLFSYWGQGLFITSGEGSEIIGDLYINFGSYLTIIIFFIFGYFISYVQFRAYFRPSYKIILLFLVLLNTAIIVNRAPFLMPLKDIFYIFILDALFRKFFVKYNNKSV